MRAMNPRVMAFAAALSVIAVVPVTASAQRARGGTSPSSQQNLLELGRGQFEDLRYEEAVQTLSAAIIRRGNTSASEIQIYELLALSSAHDLAISGDRPRSVKEVARRTPSA